MSFGTDLTLLITLIHQPESQTLDFKRDQYKFYKAPDTEKAELLKDILAFANAWKSTDAYILIGVEEGANGKATLCGVANHLKDNDLQQFVNTKTNRSVHFLCGTVSIDGNHVDYIRIDAAQERPIYLQKAFGGLKQNAVYIRHGSSTAEASPQEIAEIGANESENAREIPSLQLEFANCDARETFGNSASVMSIRLIDRPPPPIDQLPKALQKLGRENLQSLMRQASDVKLSNMSHLHSSLISGPSKQEIRKYREEMALLTSVGFCVQNTGTRTASNVEMVGHIPLVSTVTLIDRQDLPQMPRSSLQMPPLPVIPTPGGLTVSSHRDHWEVHFAVGDLQPKATSWIWPDLFVGASQATTLQMTAKLFSDDVPNPPDIEMTLRIEVEERIYQESDYEADNA